MGFHFTFGWVCKEKDMNQQGVMMVFNKDVIESIDTSIGKCEKESGGIIGSVDSVISCFEYDEDGSFDDEYVPNVEHLNKAIVNWSQNGIAFEGIVHSHKKTKRLSYADVSYARDIIRHNGIVYLYMLVYVLSEKQLYAYKVEEDRIIEEEISIR